jgi:hypothetical protein
LDWLAIRTAGRKAETGSNQNQNLHNPHYTSAFHRLIWVRT